MQIQFLALLSSSLSDSSCSFSVHPGGVFHPEKARIRKSSVFHLTGCLPETSGGFNYPEVMEMSSTYSNLHHRKWREKNIWLPVWKLSIPIGFVNHLPYWNRQRSLNFHTHKKSFPDFFGYINQYSSSMSSIWIELSYIVINHPAIGVPQDRRTLRLQGLQVRTHSMFDARHLASCGLRKGKDLRKKPLLKKRYE